MKKLSEKTPLKVYILLCAVVLCIGIAFVTYSAIQSRREAEEREALYATLKLAIGEDCNIVDQHDETRLINGQDQHFMVYETDKGTAIQSTDLHGFKGPLSVLVGFNDNGDILGYTILESHETPEYGAAADKWFQTTEKGGKGGKACIIGLTPQSTNLKVTEDGGDVDAITGSTITSRAFLRAVQQAYYTYMGKGADASTGATMQEHQEE